ncbi:hypothetical protein [Acidicapsa acidisoli]|uniref:hypothetical protein n=1 Tax=Acidicapsa acidisoli TaxID=1615681 RepID=UPI0021E0D1E3|nr:hypothetical protein [Acidicapsa acidisoli]
MAKSKIKPASWQHEIVSDHNVKGRKYRFNVDENRQTIYAKVTAEYFNDTAGSWRPVSSEYTKEVLYAAVSKREGR